MKHYGDITKLSGYDLPVVDVITGGSPCQDLSVAGKREGLSGQRSGLFMEQVRIVKEMREREKRNGRTNKSVRPRFMVWENVPGAFSSNGGKDFQAVITEIVRIADPKAPDVPLFGGGGRKRWDKAGCLYDDMGRWSVAWRVHDAQFWGVPQRRKRIALVADFGGLTAPEVLFERKGLQWNFEQGEEEREEVAGSAGEGVETASRFNGWQSITASMPIIDNGVPPIEATKPPYVYSIGGYYSEGMKSKNPTAGIYEAETSRTLDNNGGNPACNQGGIAVVYDGSGITSQTNKSNPKPGDPCHTLHDDGRNYVVESQLAVCIGNGQVDQLKESEKVGALNCMHDQQAILTAHTLKAKSNCDHREDSETYVVQGTVRRLTPLECERLQGFPDGWTNISEWTDTKGKKHQAADSPRYKALGNSIALPFWFYLLRRIAAQYERQATLGSLFDGIGGFPLCWERCNGQGTALWASEIEEFPIAVTKARFPE